MALAMATIGLLRMERNRLHATIATPATLESITEESIGSTTGTDSPEQRYAKRVQALFEAAIRNGTVSYVEVVQATYEPDVVTPQVVAGKSAYRRRLRDRADFLADYQLADMDVTVAAGHAVWDSLQGGWMRGVYTSGDNTIVLTRGGSRTTVCHETGHALQSNAVSTPANVSDRATFAAFRAGRITDVDERRLRYLANQKELELSLQDLNRFHALAFRGRPIMNARDAITALHALGMPMLYQEVAPLFDGAPRPLPLDEFEALLRPPAARNPGDRTAWRQMFPDAHRLLQLRTLALQADATLWPPLLRKIVLEAPGHL